MRVSSGWVNDGYGSFKIEKGNIVTDWSPAPEDVDSATAKSQLTADQASAAVSKLTSADGIITKAQSDIKANADAITEKVSKTVYDKNTGELTEAVSKAQSTADGVVSTVGNYQTSNDKRVAAAESKIEQNSKDITAKVSQTDYDDYNSKLNTRFTEVKATADGAATTVGELSTKVNDLGQINIIPNSDFTPDLGGWWELSTGYGVPLPSDIIINGTRNGSSTMGNRSSTVNYHICSPLIGIVAGKSYSVKMNYDTAQGFKPFLTVVAMSSSGNPIGTVGNNGEIISVQGTAGYNQTIKYENLTIPSGVDYVSFVFWFQNSQYMTCFSQPMMVIGSTIGSYVSGNYNNNDKVARQQIKIDSISNIVSDPSTGLSVRLQTAEGILTTVKSTADGAMSKVSQTANDITREIDNRKTGDTNTLQSSKDFTQSSIISAVNGVNSTITQTANGILASVSASNLVVNSEFDPLDKFWYTMGGVGSAVTGLFTWPTTNKYGDWAVVSGSRTVEYGVASSISSELKPASPLTAYSASILAGRSAVPSSSVAIDFRIAFWDSSRQLLSMSSSGNIIDGATSKSIALYKNENKISPLGTAYVSVCIAHSSNLVAETLSRPMLNVGATVSPYSATRGTDSSGTILSLFKDNWSIGITDNIGKITSGIVGDTGSMSLISKNITLDGNTTVTGDFYAKGGNFKNLNASNMTVGTLNGSQVNITNVNAANITGDITNFIQSNWNGVYGSMTITSSGMTIVSPGTVALFNINGMTLDGAGGMTKVANGFTQIYSATHENIGMIGHQKDVDHDNVDYITFGLNGYRTTNDGDSHWVGGSDFYGGDGMGFGVSNKKGTYDLKLRWDSDLIAGYKGELQGWHASDQFIFDNKTFHKGYADFSGGVTMSGAYSEGTRSLHTQGMSISTGAKWFGFMDSSNSTGFGTDQTNDVLFYVKGQVYSLYTMLGKLGMR